MKVLKEIISWIGSIGFAFVLAMVISIFVFQPTQVKGISMENTLNNNDKVLISKLSHTFNKAPEYGDIVIIDSRVDRERTFKDEIVDTAQYNLFMKLFFNKKNEQEIFWIKRVIGKGGDTIEIKDGKVYRNGTFLEEPYIKEPMNKQMDMTVTVPDNHVFVMGDNRNYSKDSRYIGCVPLSHVVGKYIYRLKF